MPLGTANGLESDRRQPLVVIADRSEYSEKLQRQTLTGNVVVTQGSLRIRADKIVIHLNQGALDRVEASGQPADFEQLDDREQRITGQGGRVQYSAVTGQMAITGKAVLTNPRQSLSGERIDYNIDTQAVEAQGDDGQVKIVIQSAVSEIQ